MNYKPIIIVSGEPNSVFLEIFFKTLKKKKFKSPILIICSHKLFLMQMKRLNFNFVINPINLNFDKLNLKKKPNKPIKC